MELRVHLKICEGCGCLWYRAQVETRVYCTSCLERFKQFPTAQSRKRRGRPRKTVLPTVFAVQATREVQVSSEVQATSEMIFQERSREQSHARAQQRSARLLTSSPAMFVASAGSLAAFHGGAR